MSYILDALRKSEQERQMASGRGAGMLYPVTPEHSPKREIKPFLFAGVALAVAAGSIALIWWPSPKLPATGSASKVEKTIGTVVAPSAMARSEEFMPPLVPERKRKAVIAEPVARASEKSSADAVSKKNAAPAIREQRPDAPVIADTDQVEPGAEPLKGLPKLTISGYINDEQGGRLAIINDRLVREGEEVSPGLRLEKVIDDSAVFNYRGHRFRR